jgi:hypothetical protein
MTPEERDLLHRHLNGDLDAGEQAAFLQRLQSSPELRRELASHAFDETLLSELVLEGRPAAKAPARRRTWIPASIAAALLVGLAAMLFRGNPPADPARPEPPKSPAERPGVADAVRRGCEFLESRKVDIVAPIAREKRFSPPSRRSYAELALLALHRGGYPDSHPLKAELLGHVTGRTVEATYAAALQAIALAEIDPVAHHERIRYCAQLLVDSQAANGQWDYNVKLALPDVPATGRIRRRAEGPPAGDNSVTAYAVLGLRACVRAGADIDPDVIARARAWWLKGQNPDGGWGYNDPKDPLAGDISRKSYTTNASYGSTTAGGVASLAALREMREDDGRSDDALRRGLEWLAGKFTADRTPGKDAGFLPVHWLVMAGRAGEILRADRFGAHDWYAEGSDFLLRAQRPTGQWEVESGEFLGPEKNDIVDTCLAILFLRRKP